MEIKNNFANVICLGHFNPSILTPNFIREVCKLELDGTPQGQTTPVVSNLQWGNILFLVEMERILVQETNIANFKDTKVIQYFERYLGILSHTPVFVCGLNLNVSLHDFDIGIIDNNLLNKDRMLRILKTDVVTIEKKEIIKKDSLEWQVYNFVYPSEDKTQFRLNLRKNQGIITFNFNYEISDLNSDINRIKKLNEKLTSVLDMNQTIVKSITEV